MVVVGFVFKLVTTTSDPILRSILFTFLTLGMISLSIVIARAVSISFYRVKKAIHTRSWNFLNKVSIISIFFGLLLGGVQIFTVEKYSNQLFGTSIFIDSVPSSVEPLKKAAFISIKSMQVQFSKRAEYTHVNKSNKSVKQSITAVAYPVVTDSLDAKQSNKVWVGYTYYGKDDTKYEDFVKEISTKSFLVETSENELFTNAVKTANLEHFNPDSLLFLRPIESKEDNVFTLQSTFLLIYSFVDLLFAIVLFLYSKRMVYARTS